MVSKRLNSLEPSPTLEVTAKAKAMKARGIDIIGFGAGEPDFDTPMHIKEALITALKEGFIYYTEAAGIQELREAISGKFKKDNKIEYSPSEIIVTPGAKQALFESVMALINPGEEVLIPQPHWVSYEPMVTIAGGNAVPVPTKIDDEFKLLPEEVEKKITPKTRVIIINTPNNPTGAVLNRDELKRLAELCIEKDLFVISDEIYEHIIYEDTHISIASVKGMKERTITVNGMSKAYSMTGWRLGYAAGPEQVIQLMTNLQSHSISNTTSFVQKAGVAALNSDQSFIREMVKEFRKRRNVMIKLLHEIEGVNCLTPGGAFYSFPDISHFSKDSLAISQQLLEDAKVAVIPGIAFGEFGEGFIRLSYATNMENIEEGMRRIDKALRRIEN